MNSTAMIQTVGMRLHSADPARSVTGKFPDAMKLVALNNAVIRLAHKLHPNYLTDLQTVQTSLTATSGQYSLSSLAYDVLRGSQGILNVKINGGLYCTPTTIQQRKRSEEGFLKSSVMNPLYYIYDEKIYVEAGVTDPVIDVMYLKEPNKMLYKVNVSAHGTPSATTFLGDASQGLSVLDDKYNGVVIWSVARNKYYVVTDYDAIGATPGVNDRAFTVVDWDSSGVNWGDDEIWFVTNWWDTMNIKPVATDPDIYLETCELNPALHNMVVDLAVAECWAMDNQQQRKDAANEIADVKIKALNAMYRDAEGIGTTGLTRTQG